MASSSAGIFGEQKTLPIYEDNSVEPGSPYGCTKLCIEKQCLAYAKIFGIEAVCFRYFNVYGTNQRYDDCGNVITIFVFQMLRGDHIEIFGDGEQTRDFVHVADVALANLQAAERAGVVGAFNLGSGTRVTINELVALLRKVSGIDIEVRHGPPRPGDVRHSIAGTDATSGAFGYHAQVGLDDGLAEYVAWALSELERNV